MAITYEQVRQVISVSPDSRRDFDINPFLPWFQKRSIVFKNLKTKLLFDVIKNVQLTTVEEDEIIIQQGDKGDCMYIILGGQVTIYNSDVKKSEGEQVFKPTGQPGTTNSSSSDNNKENLRQQLGNFIVTLKSGSAFGEVALMTDDCIRSATVIADVRSDLMVIDRELYNRSIKKVLKAEFDQKTDFIQSNPYFNNWTAKCKKQLTMALEKETLSYESILTKQGNTVEAVYFILTGEVNVVMDTEQHLNQYPKQLAAYNDNTFWQQRQKDLRGEDVQLTRSETLFMHNNKHCPRKGQKIEVCLLGINQAIGDIELLTGLHSYMQTCTCTQKTEVLVLDLKHFERLIFRRNPRTFDQMKEGLELRIKSRMSHNASLNVPLLSCLRVQAALFRLSRQQQQLQKLQSNNKDAKINKGSDSTDFTPFQSSTYRTVNRYLTKTTEIKADSGQNGFQVENDNEINSSATTIHEQPVNQTTSEATYADYESSLEMLENRMQGWMDRESLVNPTSNKRTATTRVAKLHRTQTELDQMKPGAKVIIRPKRVAYSLSSYFDVYENDEPTADRTKLLTSTDLEYYKMALTASIPAFVQSEERQ